MRKPQSQPSLAPLTEAEREQLADWLRCDQYHTVLERVNKPRPEGFSLNLATEKPLRTFYAKVALLDLINTRLPDDKKLTLATFESLAAGEILLLGSPQNAQSTMLNPQFPMNEKINRLTTEAHAAILRTTHDLATSGDNSPTQLRSLQHLADLPARAALRAQRAELQAEMHDHKIALDLRKEERQCETHSWKSASHSRQSETHSWKSASHSWKRKMQEHTIEMDEHRKRMDLENLEIKKRYLQLAENTACAKSSAFPPQSDQFGPYAKNSEDVSERVRIGLGISKEESARRAELCRTWKDPNIALNSSEETTPSAPSASSAVNSPTQPKPLNLVDLLNHLTPNLNSEPSASPPPSENLQSTIYNHQFSATSALNPNPEHPTKIINHQ